MAGNTFGTHFRLTTFGESHGSAIGGVLDGCPAGLEVDLEAVQRELDRRKPGQSALTTQRKESDTVRLLSGLWEGKTTGTPIGFTIANEDAVSKDYSHLKDTYRPSHADFTYEAKYGIRDYRGGGRSSARETATRVVAGAIARQFLEASGVSITAYVSQVGEHTLGKPFDELDSDEIENNPLRWPDPDSRGAVITYLEGIRDEGDSVGGVITGVLRGVSPGLGEPVFDKLHARLGSAMLGINAVKGFEIGSGFAAAGMRGSQHNDAFELRDGRIQTQTNYSGGIQGGISNGQDIMFRVAFKPVATIAKDQDSVNREGESVTIQRKGRHDPCVVPRAVPIVEAMAALVLADFQLATRSDRM